MSEAMKDSSPFKLFGKTITMPPPPSPAEVLHDSDVSLSQNTHSSFASSTSQDSKDELVGDYESTNPNEEKSSSSDTSDDSNKDKSCLLKKPDKIIPCPRCSSMDTKFCYFNNYNVNQPRHFCKKCQRYWTSGGTMRNVPVGSGRRKTKNALLPDYHSIMVSSDADILQTSLESNNWLISHHGFPVSFYPATLYLGSGVARNDNNPPPLHQLPVVLGKHPREGKESLDRVLVPKTLRIHDPIEAAKSSIWSTLGVKNDSLGLFKAFELKGDSRRGVGHRAMMLQANPAAFSRSVNFQERA